MGKIFKRILCAILALVGLCAVLAGCSGERRRSGSEVTTPLSNDPILPVSRQTQGVAHTPVYATVFGDTVVLATYPVLEWGDFEEPDCPVREISQGGKIACGGEHEKEIPITRVLIAETLVPDSTSEWFSGLTHLSLIEGLELLDPRYVTDMTDMFRDCGSLRELPEWYTEE